MFLKELSVLCNIPVIKTADPKIKNNAEQQRKIKNSKIKPIILRANYILNASVNSQYPERLDQEIDCQ